MKTTTSLKRSWSRWKGSLGTFMESLDREGVPYLSHSKVVTLERCPLCYYDQYIMGEKLDSTPVVVGSLFHKAAKAFYQAMADYDTLPDTGKMMKDLALRHLDKESKAKLRNALTTLRNNQWKGYSVVCLEDPFFMDLCPGLPPIIGVPDLVLSQNRAFVVVDHKTSKTFKDLDSSQLVLYAEYIRRDHGTNAIVGAFDEYRLVPDLSKIKKPVFRRTPVSVDRSFLPALIQRYRRAWKRIARMHRGRAPSSSPDCWRCNSYGFWG